MIVWVGGCINWWQQLPNFTFAFALKFKNTPVYFKNSKTAFLLEHKTMQLKRCSISQFVSIA